jgi:gamma-glutamylcyclotransferase
MQPTFHYFAYGSNLLSARLKERTPSARVVGPAVLDRHELRWHKAAADGSGKCDVVQVDEPVGRQVLGVVYQIALSEKPDLDAAETLGVGYAEREAVVQIAGSSLNAWLYYAIKIDAGSVPYDWYKALVLGGAKEHALDARYVRMLQAVQSKQDEDTLRAERHFGLANSG